MASGIEFFDDDVPRVLSWKKTSSKPSYGICFKIHSKNGWMIDFISDKTKSVEEQFDQFKNAFSEGQSRLWIFKVPYQKKGDDTNYEAMCAFLRRGAPISKKAKSFKMQYACGKSVVVNFVGNIKKTFDYDGKDIDMKACQVALANQV
eukprot:g3823.t1